MKPRIIICGLDRTGYKILSMAQEVFDFESVLSPPEIEAPAFASSALGGRILGNGIVADSLWVAITTMITPIAM
jgi:hypothetical protein